MSVHAVEIKGLTHHYADRVALTDVSFGVEAGVLFGLLGPNGGGKTTLFRIISTLLAPSTGTARVFGHDTVAEPAAVRRRLGIVFQEPALDDELTVRENLRFHGALYGLHGRHLAERIDDLLEQFDLSGRADDRVRTLSGGLQRRVDLLRGLLHKPALLLLDEPTAGLDPVARHAFWQTLADLRRVEGMTMLVATHLLDEGDACNVLAIIDQGKLVALDAPQNLKDQLGSESLWLKSADPLTLRDHIQSHFGITPRLVEGALQIAHPEAHRLLASFFDTFGDQIVSATVRRPTLEDVFLLHTGHRLSPADAAFEAMPPSS
jgi:ABC-2 type transport system ATP-binding protein